jgi:hypothetical protein
MARTAVVMVDQQAIGTAMAMINIFQLVAVIQGQVTITAMEKMATKRRNFMSNNTNSISNDMHIIPFLLCTMVDMAVF